MHTPYTESKNKDTQQNEQCKNVIRILWEVNGIFPKCCLYKNGAVCGSEKNNALLSNTRNRAREREKKNYKDITTARYFNDYTMNRWTRRNAKVHVLHMVVIAPKAIRVVTVVVHRRKYSRPTEKYKSSTRKSVKCVTNETYYFLLKQRQISPKAQIPCRSAIFTSRPINTILHPPSALHFSSPLRDSVCTRRRYKTLEFSSTSVELHTFDENEFFGCLFVFFFCVCILCFFFYFYFASAKNSCFPSGPDTRTHSKWNAMKFPAKRAFLCVYGNYEKKCDDWQPVQNNNNDVILHSFRRTKCDKEWTEHFFRSAEISSFTMSHKRTFRIFINSMEFTVQCSTLLNSTSEQENKIQKVDGDWKWELWK